jgi:signal transduction histidine kinase
MVLLLYLRLILLTAGTLLPFFWMVVILGHRRRRNLERIFFFLSLALVCFFGTSLMALNAELYYGVAPPGLLLFCWVFHCLGLWSIVPLVVHLHVEYAAIRELVHPGRPKLLWLLTAWLPAIFLFPALLRALRLRDNFRFEGAAQLLGLPFQIWLIAAIAIAAWWQRQFAKVAPDDEQKSLHRGLKWDLYVLSLWIAALVLMQPENHPQAGLFHSVVLAGLVLVPLLALVGNVQRRNFLQVGQQRNLIYAVFVTFLALLYLSFVRRASLWLDPYVPPEASAGVLLFLPVVFFEPLQRIMRRLLWQTAQTEVDRVQKLMGPINESARRGDVSKLAAFTERWIAGQLQLAEVHVSLYETSEPPKPLAIPRHVSEEIFDIRRADQHLGSLRVRAHGAMISGETFAALDFVCEQLPAAFDLCRMIGEKLQLERDLAERERLALVGQMAASISHNLKNPLGSIKTILQVQMENPGLPPSMRHETQMILDEINRLSGKLNQLLQFSRPGVFCGGAPDHCGLMRVAENVVNVLRHEAENRGVTLELQRGDREFEVAATGEMANDILSNLVLNAIEAVPRGGGVRLSLHSQDGKCTASIEDNGPGILPGLEDKILKPFFTTKVRGTGLGLAIVVRRLEEIGGGLEFESPILNGRGTRFQVTLPLAPKDHSL